jgi:hypothetical protein
VKPKELSAGTPPPSAPLQSARGFGGFRGKTQREQWKERAQAQYSGLNESLN